MRCRVDDYDMSLLDQLFFQSLTMLLQATAIIYNEYIETTQIGGERFYACFEKNMNNQLKLYVAATTYAV